MATDENPIPREARPKVATYLQQMPDTHALVMVCIIKAWWADYKATGCGARWTYWWQNHDGVEVSTREIMNFVGLSAEDVDLVMRLLAQAGDVSVEVAYNILQPEPIHRWYKVLPTRAAVLLNVGIADEASYREHMAFVEVIKNVIRGDGDG